MAILYKIGDDGAAVRSLQQRLREVSRAEALPPVYIDGIYGAQTAEAVRAFQRSRGLPLTGEADVRTLRELEKTARALELLAETLGYAPRFSQLSGGVLQAGERSDDVYVLQVILRNIAVVDERFLVPITGVYDEATVQAVRLFQGFRGGDQTGVTDRALWNELITFQRRFNENYAV